MPRKRVFRRDLNNPKLTSDQASKINNLLNIDQERREIRKLRRTAKMFPEGSKNRRRWTPEERMAGKAARREKLKPKKKPE